MTELSFEQSLARLEEIVRVLERSDLDLEQSLKLFEEGISHLRAAGSSLKAVDARVQQLVEAADGSFSVVDLGA
ncbi:exodeoxyribonuclease VII small subunit [Gemmatimonas sp.]|jgi:exodeoxyribonuclease VII small subunit|uniref:exodeoxyribonuclease VII small subunit n=1 Tax=Gemmatimonas sp. TaxID=1962908 RepID=UPI0031C5BB16|nr:exodeoxyribonuclease VII small subunit [Gemmatimonas sp.]